jgi:hypothetical protein
MNWLVVMVLLSPAQLVAQVAPGTTPVRFDDLWSGTYQCPMGVPHAETIRISQRGRTLTAVKLTGDPCVPAGMVTWEGTLPRDVILTSDLPMTLPVRVTVGNSRTTSATAGTVTIDSPSHMRLGGGGGVVFTRGASPPPGPPPTAYAPGQGAPSPGATRRHPTTRAELAVAAAPAIGMPTAEDALARITVGDDPTIGAMRQLGALKELQSILNSLPANRLPSGRGTVDLMGDYMEAQGPIRRGFATPAERDRAEKFVIDEALRQQLLSMMSPNVRKILDDRRAAKEAAQRAAEQQAEAAAKAADERRAAAQKAEAAESEVAAREAQATAAEDAQIAEAAEREVSQAKGSGPEVFGIRLGSRLALPSCTFVDKYEFDVKERCLDKGRIRFPPGKLPRWAEGWGGIRAIVKASVLVAITIDTPQNDDLMNDLIGKFGKPTKVQPRVFSNGYGIESKGEDWEWALRGVHVDYTLNEGQPVVSARNGTLTVQLESFYKGKNAKNASQDAKRVKF